MAEIKRNIPLTTDSYKPSHWKLYDKGTTRVYSHLISRGSVAMPGNSDIDEYDEVVAFGFQAQLMRYLTGRVLELDDIKYAKERLRKHFGRDDVFHEEGWLHILRDHGGRLPLLIKAVPEGTVIPTHNIIMSMENTCPQCYWLTNYLETLVVQNWYPTTVATQSRAMKKTLLSFLETTGDPSLIDYKLHDFGFRGSSSVESAGIGGMAHLVNFKGTDTLEGIEYAYKYYKEDMAGNSIPATEHAVMSLGGEKGELERMARLLEKYPTAMIACVSDTFNIFRALKEYWGDKLKDKVLMRDGVLVIRPDSGNPARVLPDAFRILGDSFGYEVNKKEFKVLNPKVRLIQGDGVKKHSLGSMLSAVCTAGWSADNITFGSGGGLLQDVNRDTLKIAFKASLVTVNGVDVPVFKKPVTDPGKDSMGGRFKLVHGWPDGIKGYHTIVDDGVDKQQDHLQEIFRDGELLIEESFAKIRERANVGL